MMKPPVFNDNHQNETQPEEEQGNKENKGGTLKRNLTILFGLLFVMVMIVGGVFIWNNMKDGSNKNEEATVSSRIVTPNVKQESNEPKDNEKETEESKESKDSSQSEKKSEAVETASKEDESTYSDEGNDENLERVPVEKGITEDTYAGVNQLSDDVTGYQYGTYINVYRLNERRSPDTDSDPLSLLQIGNSLNIVSMQTSGNRVWGELSNGSWVCLKQDNVLYCYGPGLYNCLSPIPVYNGVDSTEQAGELKTGWQVYITHVEWVGNSVWGVLEDGKAIILDTDQKSYVTH